MNPRRPIPAPHPVAPQDALADLLSRAPLPQLSALAAAHDGNVYLVGGALRDAVLGLEVADLDIAVEPGFEEFLHAVAAATGRAPSPIGDRWRRTHRLRWHGKQLDLAMLLGPLDQDLLQRDFTVNAMAIQLPAPAELRAMLVDPYGGMRDLEARRIRSVSEHVLDADPLRLLRAMRYLATLPGFDLDPATATWIDGRAARVAEVAPERLQTEWSYLLGGAFWAKGIEMAQRFRLVEGSLHIDPDLEGVHAWSAHADEATLSQAYGVEPATGRLAATIAGDVRERGRDAVNDVLTAARWPARIARQATCAAAWAESVGDSNEDELADWVLLDRSAAALAAALADVRARARGCPASAAISRLHILAERAGETRWVSGRDLRNWGMEQGPGLGAVLAEAARGQLLRRWENSDAAIAWARGRATLARRASPLSRGAGHKPGGSQ